MSNRIAAVVGAVTAVGWALVSGAFTVAGALVDPSFLIAYPSLFLSLGFQFVKGGELVLPSWPWENILLVLVAVAIVLTLTQIYRKRKKNP